MKALINKLMMLAIVPVAMIWSPKAMGFSHAFINNNRSSTETHVFVTQAIEGEYGIMRAQTEDYPEKQVWKGYGFRNGFGLEVMKFVQFGVSHTFVNMRNQGADVERLTGSRLSGDIKLIFSAPIGNLEAGSGLIGSRLDYQGVEADGSMYGSGVFYSLGINYFLSSRISLFGNAKMNKENLVKTSGEAPIENLKAQTTSLGFGFNIWL